MITLHKLLDRKLNVCAYARISNDKAVLETSLDEQIDFYTRLIINNPNWSFCGIYADDGISGTTTINRTQFLNMIEKAEAGMIDIILVKSISRFARNVIDLLETIRQLRSIGVEVIFERENLSSLDTKCDEMLTCYAKFAEEEALSMSKNVKWRVDKNKAEGRYFFPPNLMGFKTIDGQITIDEPSAKWIRKIYEMYVDDRGIDEIIAYLENNKVKSPTGKNRWNSTSIRSILMNEKYVGDCLMQKEIVVNCITHERRKNYGEQDQVFIQNGHPAIVDRELWNKAQEIRESRRTHYNIQRKENPNYKVDHTFSRFAYCPYCHTYHTLKTNHYNGQPTRRFLQDGSNTSSKVCKKGETVFADVLSKAIIKEIDYLKANLSSLKKALIQAFTNPCEINQQAQIDALESKIKALRLKNSELESRSSEFTKALKDEIITQITALTKEKLKIENDILISSSAEVRANKIITNLKAIDVNESDIHNVNFRSVFVAVIVKQKDDLIFVIGNPNLESLPKVIKPTYIQSYDYRVRKTTHISKFGIYINY